MTTTQCGDLMGARVDVDIELRHHYGTAVDTVRKKNVTIEWCDDSVA
jgi:hypothetical protein